MKTKLLFTTIAITGLFLTTQLFCSCGNNKEKEKTETVAETSSVTEEVHEMDTDFDKYVGQYSAFSKVQYSLNKFPMNSVVHTQTGDKYLPLDKRFIGKYFLVEDFGTTYDTNNIKEANPKYNFPGGYMAPEKGMLLVGVDKTTGALKFQNFDNNGKTGDVMDYNLAEGVDTWGKFVPRNDGKFDLSASNTQYTWTKR